MVSMSHKNENEKRLTKLTDKRFKSSSVACAMTPLGSSYCIALKSPQQFNLTFLSRRSAIKTFGQRSYGLKVCLYKMHTMKSGLVLGGGDILESEKV